MKRNSHSTQDTNPSSNSCVDLEQENGQSGLHSQQTIKLINNVVNQSFKLYDQKLKGFLCSKAIVLIVDDVSKQCNLQKPIHNDVISAIQEYNNKKDGKLNLFEIQKIVLSIFNEKKQIEKSEPRRQSCGEKSKNINQNDLNFDRYARFSMDFQIELDSIDSIIQGSKKSRHLHTQTMINMQYMKDCVVKEVNNIKSVYTCIEPTPKNKTTISTPKSTEK